MSRIFHYTSIDNLKLILENKTIRFNSMANMDDMKEGFSIDFGDLSRYLYSSSWTKDKNENIPLWVMYTDNMKGVRIEADSDFLEIEEDRNGKVTNITNENALVYRLQYGNNSNSLVKVKYSEEYKSCIKNSRGFIGEEILDIGRIKPTAWSFQNEWRFRLLGINKNKIVSYGDNDYLKFGDSIYINVENDMEFIDVKFNIDKLSNANFVIGPNTNQNDYDRVTKMVYKYITNFEGEIEKSKLKIRFSK